MWALTSASINSWMVQRTTSRRKSGSTSCPLRNVSTAVILSLATVCSFLRGLFSPSGNVHGGRFASPPFLHHYLGFYPVARWERGEVVPRDKYHERLARLFGVSAEAIAFGPATRGRYVVALEGPGLRLVSEHASRVEAMVALKQEIARLEAGGATIMGTLPMATPPGGRPTASR